MTLQRKPATYLKRRKVQEIAKLDFCWVLKMFDSRWLEDFLSRAGDHGTHFHLKQGVAAFICNLLAGGVGCRKGGRNLFFTKV